MFQGCLWDRPSRWPTGSLLEPREASAALPDFLYSADLMGGWLGGIIGGVVLLPVMGLTNTSLAIVIFKILSLALLLAALNYGIRKQS